MDNNEVESSEQDVKKEWPSPLRKRVNPQQSMNKSIPNIPTPFPTEAMYY